MLDYPNTQGMDNARKSAIAQAPKPAHADKLSRAKQYLQEIGGARPGVLDRWLESKSKGETQ